MNSIVHYNSDWHKHKAYATTLNDSKDKNNLYAAIVSIGIEGD